ncbi:MAG: efflux RND transporter periplasmic adaptor subunit, partial [Sphingomonas sp.]
MFFAQRQKLIALAIGAALALTGCGGKTDSGPPQMGAPEVTVATPLSQEIVDWDEYVGRFEAVQTVEVRPRATGYLSGVYFRDGEFVRKNQLLFTVDPRPAKAALAQAVAQQSQAQATLANARTELTRSETLYASRAASKEEVESRQAAVRSAEAQVA